MSEGPLDIEPFEVYLDHAIGDKEHICELTKSSSVLYGIFVDVMRQFYMGGKGYIKGCPQRIYDYDKNKTHIWIDKEMRWEEEHPEFRPAIYVKIEKLNVDYPTGRVPYEVDKYTDTHMTLRLVHGNVSFVHIAKTAGEATMLCDNTLNYLWIFGDKIRADYCMSTFRPVSQVPVMKGPQASKEHWMSVCTCSFEFFDVSGVRQEAPVLQDIRLGSLQQLVPSGILRGDLRKPRQGEGV